MLSEPERAPNLDKSQAARIINKFGGAVRLARILAEIGKPKSVETIYRWTYPRSRSGTDGYIPATVWPDLIQAARAEGLLLTSEDFDPRARPMTQKTGRSYPRVIRQPSNGPRR